MLNLNIAVKHGPAVWKAHNARTDALIKDLDRRLHATEVRITDTNRKRKLRQEQARGELERLHAEYTNTLKKNIAIEIACRKIEDEAAAAEGASDAGAAAPATNDANDGAANGDDDVNDANAANPAPSEAPVLRSSMEAGQGDGATGLQAQQGGTAPAAPAIDAEADVGQQASPAGDTIMTGT